MHIALVCPYSLSTPGGVQAQVIALHRALGELGHEAVIIAPGGAAGTARTGRAFSFRVNGSVAAMAPHPAAAIRTVRLLRRGGYDVVHLHEPLAPSITLAALFAHVAPTVGTFHAAGEHTPYRWFAAPLRRLARRLDVRVAVSESAAELAGRYLGGTYETLFNGIDTKPFSAIGGKPAERTVMFIGRHEPRKGLAVLLDAVPLLPSDVTVLIAGDGPDTRRLRERYADDRVQWLGRLSEHDKTAYLRSASVLCAPSLRDESFGVVLLEAMACGTPVVASDLHAYRTVSNDGSAAQLVPPGDVDALADALRRVIENRSVADALIASGYTVVQRYSISELARRYVEIYERLCPGIHVRSDSRCAPMTRLRGMSKVL